MSIKLTPEQAAALGLVNNKQENINAGIAMASLDEPMAIAEEGTEDLLNKDLSLAGLDERIRALKLVANTGNYYDLDVKCNIATENNDGIMSKDMVIKLATLEPHPNLGPNNFGNVSFPNYTHSIDEIKGLQNIAKTGLLSDLPGNQVATDNANGLMSSDAYKRLYALAEVALSGKFEDLIFKYGYKQNLNTDSYIATTEKDGFMTATDKSKFDSFFLGSAENRFDNTHLKGPGYNHLPSGGVDGQILGWNMNDTGKWITPISYKAGPGILFEGEAVDGTDTKNITILLDKAFADDHYHDERYIITGENIKIEDPLTINISNTQRTKSLIFGYGNLEYSFFGNGETFAQIRMYNNDNSNLIFNDGTADYTVWHSGNRGNASTSNPGFMSAADKTKLNTVEENANYYVHPSSHAATMITGLAKVATSGSYNDLTNQPSYIASSGVADKIKISGTARTATVSGTTLAFN